MENIAQVKSLSWTKSKSVFLDYEPKIYTDDNNSFRVRDLVGREIIFEINEDEIEADYNPYLCMTRPESLCVGYDHCDKEINGEKIRDRCFEKRVLYLSFFPSGKIKIGITRIDRWIPRILEQGATYTIRVAYCADVVDANKVEIQLHQLRGVSSRSSFNDVFPNNGDLRRLTDFGDFIPHKETISIKNKVLDILNEIKTQDSYPANLVFDKYSTLMNFEQYYLTVATNRILKIKNLNDAYGTLIGYRGPYLLLEKEGKIYALNVNIVKGHTIRIGEIK